MKANKVQIIENLLKAGADVNAQNYCGTSSLHHAASEGMLDIVSCLLKYKAKLVIMEEYNITPVFSAAQFGHDKCLQVLLNESKKRGNINWLFVLIFCWKYFEFFFTVAVLQ